MVKARALNEKFKETNLWCIENLIINRHENPKMFLTDNELEFGNIVANCWHWILVLRENLKTQILQIYGAFERINHTLRQKVKKLSELKKAMCKCSAEHDNRGKHILQQKHWNVPVQYFGLSNAIISRWQQIQVWTYKLWQASPVKKSGVFKKELQKRIRKEKKAMILNLALKEPLLIYKESKSVKPNPNKFKCIKLQIWIFLKCI